jgi:glycosyltransferase involved in cell wall biosynthesis
MTASVTIFHNVVWSRHKGVVCHCYLMQTLFDGCYEDVPLWKRIARLTRAVFKTKSDLIVLPGYHRAEYWAMLAACIVTGKRRAVFCDSNGPDRPRKLVTSIPTRVFFALCDGYFGLGERSREYLMSLGANNDKIFTPCQAAAMPRSYSPAYALEQRMRCRIGHRPVFLYVGRLSEENGIGTLLDAFAGIRMRLPGAQLRLVGTGPMECALRMKVAELGLGEAVYFAGRLQDEWLSREYYGATCLVLPSYREPWGLVVNEALSHGCPAVVSESCGCVPELIVEGLSGYAFAAGDVLGLRRMLLKAAGAFADSGATARRCLSIIGRFDPPSAAANIARGCAMMLAD